MHFPKVQSVEQTRGDESEDDDEEGGASLHGDPIV